MATDDFAKGRPSLAARLRYAFDNTMAAGTGALIAWLAIASVLLVLFMSLIVVALGLAPEGSGRLGFGEAAWMAVMRTLDAGTMGGDAGWAFRAAMLVVTLGGIFVVSTFIGVLTSGIENKLDQLRKGRSLVLETGHTLILGWSNHIFTIISELCVANENQRGACVVILAQRDKVEMEDELASRGLVKRGVRIVCRTGSPLDVEDLDVVSLNAAKSIIVLGPDDEEAPDSFVLKTLLAVVNHPTRRSRPFHIVAELSRPSNLEVAALIAKDEVEVILADDIMARVAAQTCRQSGLSTVYMELLDFAGDDIYLSEIPELNGKSFGEALLAFDESSLIGVELADGTVRLNPPGDLLIEPGMRLVAITRDDDTLVPSTVTASIDEGCIVNAARPTLSAERTLILNWNARSARAVRELDNYARPGSEVVVVSESELAVTEVEELAASLQQQKLSLTAGNPSTRGTLEAIDLASFNHVVVFGASYSDVQRADMDTIVTLLHLRDIASRRGCDVSIVSEMLDPRNRRLAEVTRADDFIVSENLISLMLAQISEEKALAKVFADLFDADGSELYLKPITDYVRSDRPVSFATLVVAARRRGEVAIGFRSAADQHTATKQYGIRVNPPKSVTRVFSAMDQLIVLAPD